VLLRLCFFTVVILLATSATLRAQSYGLRFVGHEATQDNRTSLNLTPQEPLCFKENVELTFDLTLVPNYKTYFGYVFRIIQDETQNIDLLYDQGKKCFKIIIGEHFSRSVIHIDSTQLFSQWNRFKVQLDLKRGALSVYANNQLVIKDKVSFKGSGCFKIFFGGNEFREFKSKDIPPMNIKDIALSENGRRSYYWPLKEDNKLTTKDEVEGRVASVVNPVWIKSLHNKWELAESIAVKGNASVAFDPASETVYVIGSDMLYRYSVRNQQKEVQTYQNPPPSFLPGNQSVYNPLSNKLYNFYVDQKEVSVYNPASRSWTSEAITPKFTIETEYWHANKFISRVDSSLYILGGYGQLTYKNSIQRYGFATRKWETILPKGNAYTPRYLAALGTSPTSDVAYLIGGYGSQTGEQMLNPKSSYDFLQYEVKNNVFTKLYELKVPETDFAFANSLVIDSKAKLFYGLIFPNQKFKSQLQLMRGSLSEPTYELVGNAIPYAFHDIHSFADLYYCPASQKLLAVTLYRNENNSTDVKFYTISFPPNTLEAKVADQQQSAGRFWLVALICILVGAGGFWYMFRKYRPQASEPATLPLQPEATEADLLIPEEETTMEPLPVTEPAPKASIYFFGNFQVLDSAGGDITKLFTPLLKELFLLLALNSIGKHRGLPSEKLNEILWPDKSGRDVSNNRSVNIAKLKAILDKVGFCSLSKDSGYWKVEFDFHQIHVDYERYVTIIHDKKALTKKSIIELGQITERGSFLSNTEYHWLDDFKADVSNEIINSFLHYAEKLKISDDPEFLIQITNFIFYYDSVNEDAIIIKCKALALMGKHTLAKNAFEKFARDYKEIYGEEYEQTFSAILD
jgi:hypothetical protein